MNLIEQRCFKTFNRNKACIDNDSFMIVSRKSYHQVKGLGFCPRVWDLGSRVLTKGQRSGVLFEDLGYGLLPESPRSYFSGMPWEKNNLFHFI